MLTHLRAQTPPKPPKVAGMSQVPVNPASDELVRFLSLCDHKNRPHRERATRSCYFIAAGAEGEICCIKDRYFWARAKAYILVSVTATAVAVAVAVVAAIVATGLVVAAAAAAVVEAVVVAVIAAVEAAVGKIV